MKAGFGKGEIIFPQEMFPLEGFCGVHDNPQIRIMAVESGTEKFAIAAVELVNVPAELIDHIRRKISDRMDLPKEHVWVHMTHAITTPHEPGKMGPAGRVPSKEEKEKRRLFYRAVEEAADEAVRALSADYAPAALHWSSVSCEANRNRDVETRYGWWIGMNPDGYFDHEMQVLKATGTDKKAKGFLVSYGIKPCAVDNSGMQDGTRLVSAECCGMACRLAEEKLGAPVMFVMSAAGDQVPVKMSLHEQVSEKGAVTILDEGVQTGLRYARQIAEMMAESICEAAAQAEKETADPAHTETQLPIGWDEISFQWAVRTDEKRRPQPQVTYQREDRMDRLTAQLLRLGDAVFIAAQPELNACTGKEIKDASPFAHTILMTMVNGEMKYVPDLDSYLKGTFEAQSSHFMPGAAEYLTEKVTASMLRLKEEH